MAQESMFGIVDGDERLFNLEPVRPARTLREELGGSTPEQYEAWAARHGVEALELG